MIRDLQLTFGENGVEISLTDLVEDFSATAQVAMTNVVTTRGSDRLALTRGTRLAERLLSGSAVSPLSREHQTKFAALDVMFAINSSPQTEERVVRFDLQFQSLKNQVLELNSVLSGEKGSHAGQSLLAAL